MSEKFKLGDLVWAKIMNYPPWPSRIADPADYVSNTNKKNHKFVYYFGTQNHGWVKIRNLQPYMEYRQVLRHASKSKKFQNACDDIDAYIMDKYDWDSEEILGEKEQQSLRRSLRKTVSPSRFSPDREEEKCKFFKFKKCSHFFL